MNMASPMPATAPIVTLIDPSRLETFPLHLSKAISNRQEPDRRFWSIRYNHKPRQATSVTRKTSIKRSTSRPPLPSLQIHDRDDANGEVKEHAYKGRRTTDDTSYALTYDRKTRTFTLEALGGSYGFNATSSPTPGSPNTATQASNESHSDLLEHYGDATIDLDNAGMSMQPPSQSQNQLASGPSSQANGIAGAATPASSAIESDAGGTSPPDPKNPFDYRHYLSGLPGQNAHGSKDSSSLHPSPAATPTVKPTSTLARPNGLNTSTIRKATTSAPIGGSSPLAPPSSDRVNGIKKAAPSTKVLSNTPPAGATRSRKRKATDALRPMAREKQARITKAGTPTSDPVRARDQVNGTTASMSASEPSPKASLQVPRQLEATTSHPNELVIEGEDDETIDSQPGASLVSSPAAGGVARPQSLRERAMSSRAASPAPGFRNANGDGSAYLDSRRGFLGRPRSGTLQTTSSVASQGFGGTDGDVETDLELGSPEFGARSPDLEPPRVVISDEASQGSEQHEQRAAQGEDDDDDGDGFDQAFAKAIEASDVELGEGEDDEEVDGGVVLANGTAKAGVANAEVEEESEEE